MKKDEVIDIRNLIIDGNCFVKCPTDAKGKLVIPYGIETIAEGACQGCKGITSVDIPDSVNDISRFAFTGCEGLTSLVIPDYVVRIDEWAFGECVNLKEVVVGRYTAPFASSFGYCLSLESVTWLSKHFGFGDIFSDTKKKLTLRVPLSVQRVSDFDRFASQFDKVEVIPMPPRRKRKKESDWSPLRTEEQYLYPKDYKPFEKNLVVSIDRKMFCDFSAYDIVMFVHELHKRGYEQLRLFAVMAPTGMSWRWFIYPRAMMLDGGMFERHGDNTGFECICGSTSDGRSRNQIDVDALIEKNRGYFELAYGRDPEYVAWYDAIVEHAKKEEYPIAYEEYFSGDNWKFTSSGDILPYPPFREFDFMRLPDSTIIRCCTAMLDETSQEELNYLLYCENGLKPSLHEIAVTVIEAVRHRLVILERSESASLSLSDRKGLKKTQQIKYANGYRVIKEDGTFEDIIDVSELKTVKWVEWYQH